MAKIVKIIYWGEDGLRRTQFFSNVDCVSWFETDANGENPGQSTMVFDGYADNDHRRNRKPYDEKSLAPWYVVEDVEAVRELITANPEIHDSLVSMVPHIMEAFGAETPLSISDVSDDDWHGLKLSIHVDIDAKEARERYNQVLNYWVEEPISARGLVVLSVNFHPPSGTNTLQGD